MIGIWRTGTCPEWKAWKDVRKSQLNCNRSLVVSLVLTLFSLLCLDLCCYFGPNICCFTFYVLMGWVVFKDFELFNGDISKWNTERVKNMEGSA